MASSSLLLVVVGLAIFAYYLGRHRAIAGADHRSAAHFSFAARAITAATSRCGARFPPSRCCVLGTAFEPLWLRSGVLRDAAGRASDVARRSARARLQRHPQSRRRQHRYGSPSADMSGAAARYRRCATVSRYLATAVVLVLGLVVARLGVSPRAPGASARAIASRRRSSTC